MIINKDSNFYSPEMLGISRASVPRAFNSLLVVTDDDGSFRISSDVEMIQKQQQVISSHPELIGDFFSNISPENPMKKYQDKLSDDDLFKFIKSRRYQTPAELEVYSEYLLKATEAERERFDNDMQDYLDSLNKENKDKEDASIVESPNSPTDGTGL